MKNIVFLSSLSMVMDKYSELATIFIAMMPVVELRMALPTAIFIWGMPPMQAYLFSVIGNFIPVIPLIIFWRYCTEWISNRVPAFKFFWERKLLKTRTKYEKKFENTKFIALFLLVAIPLPFTGAWTGTVASHIFGISLWRSALAIGLGIIVSGLLVLGGAELLRASI
jgi:uncharacterized membrane protein